MFIIKLGGSVITDKSKQEFFRQKIMDNLSEEIKKADKDVILVHGAGSFGHILAKKYELNDGFKHDKQIEGFSVTHATVQKLNTHVLSSLQNHRIPAVSIAPHSILNLNDHILNEINYKIFEEYLNNSFTPVTFGDVVLDKKLVFSICSGDLLVKVLAEHFKPEKIIFVIDEDGLYTSNPKKDRTAEFIDSTTAVKLKKLITSLDDHADVTLGMKGKIDTIVDIARLNIDTILLNGNKHGILYKALIGENIKGTIIHGDKR
jgi:isopentenyl phosphate kinase